MKRVFAWVVMSVAATIPAAQAQQTVNYATIGGQVTDPSGAVVETAEVTVRQMDTNIAATEKTDKEGRYRFPYLKVGPYQVSVRKTGFQEATRPVTLTVGAAFEVPFALVVGRGETKLEVSTEAPVLEAARTEIAGTISQEEVRDLPLNGRNYLDIALFVPGVSPTNTASNQLYAKSLRITRVAVSPAQEIRQRRERVAAAIGSRERDRVGIVEKIHTNPDCVGAMLDRNTVSPFEEPVDTGRRRSGKSSK